MHNFKGLREGLPPDLSTMCYVDQGIQISLRTMYLSVIANLEATETQFMIMSRDIDSKQRCPDRLNTLSERRIVALIIAGQEGSTMMIHSFTAKKATYNMFVLSCSSLSLALC